MGTAVHSRSVTVLQRSRGTEVQRAAGTVLQTCWVEVEHTWRGTDLQDSPPPSALRNLKDLGGSWLVG